MAGNQRKSGQPHSETLCRNSFWASTFSLLLLGIAASVNAGIKKHKRRKGNDPTAGITSPVLQRRAPVGQLSVRRNFGRRHWLDAGLEAVTQPVGLAPDIHYVCVVEQPVQKGGGQDVITEQLAPAAEIFVAGEDYTAVLIALWNQPEQQFRLLAVQLHISHLVNHQKSGAQINSPPAFQPALELCPFQVRNQTGESGVVDDFSRIQCLQSQTNGQMLAPEVLQ